jgi:hypothetical protein
MHFEKQITNTETGKSIYKKYSNWMAYCKKILRLRSLLKYGSLVKFISLQEQLTCLDLPQLLVFSQNCHHNFFRNSALGPKVSGAIST